MGRGKLLMKKVVAIIFILLILFGTVSVYATNIEQENVLTSDTATTNLVELKDKALKSLEDYQAAYGNDTYGLAAYLLNIVRIYSIPFGFIGIVIAAIYRYVIGIRKLDVQDQRIWRISCHYYGNGNMPSVTISFCNRC